MGDESQQLLDPSHFLCYREFSPNVIVVPPSIDRSPIVAAPTIRATATTPLRHCMLIINHAVPAMHCSVAAASHSRRLCHSCHGHVSPTLRIQWESPTPFTCRICLKYATLRWGICSNQLRNKNVLLWAYRSTLCNYVKSHQHPPTPTHSYQLEIGSIIGSLASDQRPGYDFFYFIIFGHRLIATITKNGGHDSDFTWI